MVIKAAGIHIPQKEKETLTTSQPSDVIFFNSSSTKTINFSVEYIWVFLIILYFFAMI